ADDDAGGGVGEARGIGERSACGGCECENAEHSVACSGDVENLAAAGAAVDAGFSDTRVGDFKICRGNMQRARRGFLEQSHSLFAASDQDGFAAKMREKFAAGFVERLVVGESLREKLSGFFGVADDRSCAAIRVELRAFRTDKDGNFEFVGGAENFF